MIFDMFLLHFILLSIFQNSPLICIKTTTLGPIVDIDLFKNFYPRQLYNKTGTE